jgi:hypothetical protein
MGLKPQTNTDEHGWVQQTLATEGLHRRTAFISLYLPLSVFLCGFRIVLMLA